MATYSTAADEAIDIDGLLAAEERAGRYESNMAKACRLVISYTDKLTETEENLAALRDWAAKLKAEAREVRKSTDAARDLCDSILD